MKTNIINKQTAQKYVWGTNCESFVFLDTEGLSIKQETLPANTGEKMHYHSKAQQFFYILKGEAVFYIDNELVEVKQHEGIHIKAKQKHFIVNRSFAPLEILVISQPTTNHDRIDNELDKAST